MKHIQVGDIFGRLTVIDQVASHKGHRRFLCVCSCGKKKTVNSDLLRRGDTRSCGCLKSPINWDDQTRRKVRAKIASIPHLQKGPQHSSSEEWEIRSFRGIIYKFKNLAHFIRTHETLFLREDTAWKQKGKYEEWCRAYSGIQQLKPLKRNGTPKKSIHISWKGWTWFSDIERDLNNSHDLLDRPQDAPAKKKGHQP